LGAILIAPSFTSMFYFLDVVNRSKESVSYESLGEESLGDSDCFFFLIKGSIIAICYTSNSTFLYKFSLTSIYFETGRIRFQIWGYIAPN
ncbi:hypothetical protein ACJX0J_031580, partial [Zea mays]